MSLHRTIEVLGFKKPIVKGSSVSIDITTSAGEVLTVTCTLAFWRQLDAGVVGTAALCALPVAPVAKRDPRAVTDARMQAAWAELVAGSTDTIDAIAARHGLGTQSLGNWSRNHHREQYAALMRIRKGSTSLSDYATAGLPLPKPSATSL